MQLKVPLIVKEQQALHEVAVFGMGMNNYCFSIPYFFIF